MNDDVMRLSDLVPEYARCYRVSHHEAAHALHELIQELYIEYSEVRDSRLSLNNIFWVGKTGSPQRSARFYNLSFEGISKYFDCFCNPLPGIDNNLIDCFCASDADLKKVPANVVYTSRKALDTWILNAGLETPKFLLDDESTSQAEGDNGERGLQQKERNYISLIINGLIELIKEVDKAHADQAFDEESRMRADTIKRRALGLRSTRKNFNPCPAILSLAAAAGVDMPNSPKTLRKYMGDHLPSDAGGAE